MNVSTILVENKEMIRYQKKIQIVNYVIEQTKDIDVQHLKLNPAHIQFVCCIIENQVCNKNKPDADKIDKMDIFCEIMRKLTLTDEQISEAMGIVEFLLSNKMIKKTKMKKIIYHCIKNSFLKQLGLNA